MHSQRVEVMSGTIRVLLVLGALMGVSGCIVGPQEDLPVDPQSDHDRAAGGADGDAEADGDGDLGDPPADEPGAYDDDGMFWGQGADTGEDPDDNASPAGAGVFDDGEVVPGLPTIPRPGLPGLHRGLPDLGTERSDDAAPPDLDAAATPGSDVDESSDD